MPLELCNAPRLFQRIMQKNLGHLPMVKLYLDDILIFSSVPHEHEFHITTVLKILKENLLKINYEKTKFRMNHIKYLGRIIDKESIFIDSTMV